MTTLFERFEQKTNITSERQEIVKGFVEAINSERIGTKYKPVNPKMVAIKLAETKMTKSELYWFLKKCQNATSFGKCFFGSLKCNK